MMICAWGSIKIYSNSNMIQKFGCAGKGKHKKAYLSVGSISAAAGTPKNRVWWHTRGKVFDYHVVAAHIARGSAIIPVGTTVSVHGLRPSPFPSLNSIFLYIVADLRGFVKEMGALFTIRLRMKEKLSFLQSLYQLHPHQRKRHGGPSGTSAPTGGRNQGGGKAVLSAR